MYTLYSLFTALGMLLLAPYFLVRSMVDGKYLRHIRERLAWRFSPEVRARGAHFERSKAIWIHAVSVGELLAAVPLARRLKDQYPNLRLVISTTTATGQRLALERMQCADAICYFPLDWKGPVRRAIVAIDPAAVIVMETEIWPNFLHECRRAEIPVVFVNGRLSDRSFRGFRRALDCSAGALSGFLKRILNDATLFLMQSENDAARLLELGVDRSRVMVSGNLKYDVAEPPATPLAEWLAGIAARERRHPVIVAGSVVAHEEVFVLRALAEVEQVFPRVLLVLAPRKPERFAVAARLIEESGRRAVRRSGVSLDAPSACALELDRSVFLLDSVGELASLYRLADAVFVGGSLVPGGGHNILEPAACGKPPVFGPSMENFQNIAAQFLDSNAAIQVRSSEMLASAWIKLVTDTERSATLGRAARGVVERNRGATLRVLHHIDRVLGGSRGEA